MLYKLIASVFYLGYIPLVPGTIGSLAALFVYYFLIPGPQFMSGYILISLALGLLTAGKAEKIFGAEDSGRIVIDEFTGMLVSLYLLPPRISYSIAAFFLFRFFDIVKPKPIAPLEKLKGGLGIMADDIMAGLYANLTLQVIYRALR